MIEGVRVNLLPYSDAFLKREHHWKNSAVWFWATAGNRPVVSRAQVERWQRNQTSGLWFGIQAKDGTPLGHVGLDQIETHHRQAMIGMGIGETAYWRQGYGTDALRLAVDFAFNWLDLRRLWLSTLDTNIPMQRLAEKLGFVLEARRRGRCFANGTHHDQLTYGLLRNEWKNKEKTS